MAVWDDDTTDEGKTWMDGVTAQFEAARAGVAVEVQRVQNEDFDGRLLTPSAVVEAINLYGDDPFATNAAEHPDRVVLQPNPTARLDPTREAQDRAVAAVLDRRRADQVITRGHPMTPATNPIPPGRHLNPSPCRVGEDCFLVTSTCEYFVGLPGFPSRDLVHWEQIGAVVDRVITPDDPRWTTLRFPAAPSPPQAAMAGTVARCRRPWSGEPHQPSSPSAKSTRSLT